MCVCVICRTTCGGVLLDSAQCVHADAFAVVHADLEWNGMEWTLTFLTYNLQSFYKAARVEYHPVGVVSQPSTSAARFKAESNTQTKQLHREKSLSE